MRAIACFFISVIALSEGVLICYFGRDGISRGNFDIQNIDETLCTHYIYGFAGINSTEWTLEPQDPAYDLCLNDGDGCGYSRFNHLKDSNPDLKTLVSFGGPLRDPHDYSEMANDPNKRKTFVSSALQLLQQHGFDGLDVDWEYPNVNPQDKENFVVLLEELKHAFASDNLLLTVALSPAKEVIDEEDIPRISATVDIASVMTYDYHGSWDGFTHVHSPLYPHPLDQNSKFQYSNVNFTANYYLSKGLSKDKFVLGMATYGRCYNLTNPTVKGFYAPSSGPGPQGAYINEMGILGYNEICQQRLSDDWVVVHDPMMNEPYTYHVNATTWCGYEDVNSIKKKAEFANELGLLGGMIWSVETDDHSGQCGRSYDLIRTVAETLTDHETSSSPPDPMTTTPSGELCSGNGIYFLPYPEDCSKYWECFHGEPILHNCENGLVFNTDKGICYYPDQTNTSNCEMIGSSTDTTATTNTTTSTTTTTQRPNVTDSSKPPTTEIITTTIVMPSPPGGVDCSEQGVYNVPGEFCNEYWQCVNGNPNHFTCPDGLVWNDASNICDWPANTDTSNCIMP